MALRTKDKRRITVEGNIFYWFYKFNDKILRLTVMTEEKTHSRLICDFNFRDPYLHWGEAGKDYDDKLIELNDGLLTPWVVRQIIDHARQKGWNPFEKGKDFVITEMQDKVDINFWTKTIAEERKSKIQNLKSKIL